MNTKVRVIDTTKLHTHRNETYCKYVIQILDYRYRGATSLEVIGEISWQCNRDRITEEKPADWYGMSFEVSGDMHERHRLKKMYTIMDAIWKLCDSKKPEEILAIIGAVRYFNHNGGFWPESLSGQFMYRVMKQDELYGYVVAPNERVAKKLAKKKYKHEFVVLDHIISVE